MTFEEIISAYNSATPPDSLPDNLNIGNPWVLSDDHGTIIRFHPGDSNCHPFDSVNQYYDNSCFAVHNFGVQYRVGDIKYSIHNSQIFLLEYWEFDDIIEYNRSDTRKERIGLGILLSGSVATAPLGALIGLATSFGKARKRYKTEFLFIGFWDKDTLEKRYIIVENDLSASFHRSFKDVLNLRNSVLEKIAKSDIKQSDKEPAGLSHASGCLSSIIFILTILSLGFLYSCI